MSQYRSDAEARLSCSDSSYDERDLGSSEGEHDYPSDEDSDDVEDGGEDGEDTNEDPLGLEPYQYEPFGTVDDSSTMESSSEESEDEAAWRLNNTSWYVLVVKRYRRC